MNVVLDAVLLVALVLFAVGGVLRGPRPEVVTLVGLTLGTLLADEWGAAWGRDLAATVGVLSPTVAGIIVRGLLFGLPLIVLGYGGALLLPKRGPLGFRSRLAGLALGLFNGTAILAGLLRNWYYSQDTGGALINDSATRLLLEWAGWWPLALALGGLLAVVAAAARRPRRRPVAVTSTPRQPVVTGSLAPATRPIAVGSAGTGNGTIPDPPAALPVRAATSPAAPTLITTPAPVPVKPSATGRSDGPRCRTCGNALAPGAAFCPNCGTPV